MSEKDQAADEAEKEPVLGTHESDARLAPPLESQPTPGGEQSPLGLPVDDSDEAKAERKKEDDERAGIDRDGKDAPTQVDVDGAGTGPQDA